MRSSDESACIAMNTPENSDLVANTVAPSRFSAASEEGLSEDLWAPTNTTGIGRFCKAKC